MKSNLTLQQGLEVFQRENMKYFTKRSLSEEGKRFLDCHDITHVVFGCDTSVYGEGVVKTWTTFGTTLSFWKVVNGYNEVSAFQLFRKYSLGHILKSIPRYLLVIPKVILRARRMSKPWPFFEFEQYLNIPLTEIRREYNIEVLK